MCWRDGLAVAGCTRAASKGAHDTHSCGVVAERDDVEEDEREREREDIFIYTHVA